MGWLTIFWRASQKETVKSKAFIIYLEGQIGRELFFGKRQSGYIYYVVIPWSVEGRPINDGIVPIPKTVIGSKPVGSDSASAPSAAFTISAAVVAHGHIKPTPVVAVAPPASVATALTASFNARYGRNNTWNKQRDACFSVVSCS